MSLLVILHFVFWLSVLGFVLSFFWAPAKKYRWWFGVVAIALLVAYAYLSFSNKQGG